MNKFFFLLPALLLVCFTPTLLSGTKADMQKTAPRHPIFRIPLRIHLGNSDRPAAKWLPILEEINSIWLFQAGICFEMHTVNHDDELEYGLDLWFESTIPKWNGYYTDPHDMHVRDDPDLRPADNPASSAAARTAAHELGHALGLPHRQESDDNLMRSKTYGWQLHQDEVMLARSAALQLASADQSNRPCSPPTVQDKP